MSFLEKSLLHTKTKKGTVKVKQEKQAKVKKEKQANVKKESRIKQEVLTPERKHGISQLSSPEAQIVE